METGSTREHPYRPERCLQNNLDDHPGGRAVSRCKLDEEGGKWMVNASNSDSKDRERRSREKSEGVCMS